MRSLMRAFNELQKLNRNSEIKTRGCCQGGAAARGGNSTLRLSIYLCHDFSLYPDTLCPLV